MSKNILLALPPPSTNSAAKAKAFYYESEIFLAHGPFLDNQPRLLVVLIYSCLRSWEVVPQRYFSSSAAARTQQRTRRTSISAFAPTAAVLQIIAASAATGAAPTDIICCQHL
jgi:hypothetical protein